MNQQVPPLMEQGFNQLEEENFEAAHASFTQALEFGPGNAEAWHYGALALLELRRKTEAEDYIAQALRNYDQRIQNEQSLAYNLFQKASLHAVLGQKKLMLSALAESFQNNLNYAEDTADSALFAPYAQDKDFNSFLDASLEKLSELNYRGEALSEEDLNEAQLANRLQFVHLLADKGWDIEEYEERFAEGESLSPQAQGAYYPSDEFGVRLSYYLDQNLFYLEIKNFENDEYQAFRLYPKKRPQNLLASILKMQDKIPQTPALLFVKKLLPQCQEAFYEMPNGTKMKLSKF